MTGISEGPTLGEVDRNIQQLRGELSRLSERVLTSELWKAERSALEQRFQTIEKEVRGLWDAHRQDHEDRKQRQRDDSKRQWQIWLAVAVAGLSFALNIIAASQGIGT